VGGELLAELGYEVEAPRGRLARALRRRRPAAAIDLGGAQRIVDGVLEAMNTGAPLKDLVTDDFRARVIGHGTEQRLEDLDAFLAWLDSQPSGGQLRADPHPGLPTYSVVQTLGLADGSSEDRVLEFVFKDDRLQVLVIYRFPL